MRFPLILYSAVHFNGTVINLFKMLEALMHFPEVQITLVTLASLWGDLQPEPLDLHTVSSVPKPARKSGLGQGSRL